MDGAGLGRVHAEQDVGDGHGALIDERAFALDAAVFGDVDLRVEGVVELLVLVPVEGVFGREVGELLLLWIKLKRKKHSYAFARLTWRNSCSFSLPSCS